MVFIEAFFKKEAKDITANDVEEFISRRIEENLNLEYKHIKAFTDYDELCKDIVAFANSAGGLVILGVEEEKVETENGDIRIYPKIIT